MSEPTNDSSSSYEGGPKPEVTTHQLIIGICIALLVAVVCFMCGILLGRWEGRESMRAQKSGQPIESEAARSDDSARSAVADDTGAKTTGEGLQAYPRPPRVTLPAVKPVQSTAGRPPGPATSSIMPAPAPSDGDKRPSSQAKAPEAPQTPATPDSQNQEASPGKEEDEADVSPAESPEEETEEGDKGQDIEAVPPPPTEVPAEPPAQAPPAERAEAAASPPVEPSRPEGAPPRGSFGVQVASFAGAGREKAAEDYKRRLKAGNELKVLLVPSEDGKYIRAIVGPYPDRQGADTVCKELRKRPGFEDCFVKPL